jgi:hypothetical protein
MTGEEFLLKRTQNGNITFSEKLCEDFGMIWSPKNPISQADRRINYDIWLVAVFFDKRTEK